MPVLYHPFPIGTKVLGPHGRVGTVLGHAGAHAYWVQWNNELSPRAAHQEVQALCPDCGIEVRPDWNQPPDTWAADGTHPNDDDLLCGLCFERRHGVDSMIDRWERDRA